MRTKGEAFVDEEQKLLACAGDVVGATWMSDRPSDEDIANAHTWATAHNTANQLDAMGLDGDKAIAGLPDLYSKLLQYTEADYRADVRRRGIEVVVNDFMQSIQKEV